MEKKYGIVDPMIKTINVTATRMFYFLCCCPVVCFDLLIAINIARGKKSFP